LRSAEANCALRLLVVNKKNQPLADPNQIAALERGHFHSVRIELRAIRAAAILQIPRAGAVLDPGVLPAYEVVVDLQLAAMVSADANAV